MALPSLSLAAAYSSKIRDSERLFLQSLPPSLSHPFSILHNALRDFSLSERVLLPGLAIHDAGKEQRAGEREREREESENIQFSSFTCAETPLRAIV